MLGILVANSLNTYSSGMSLLSIGVRIQRYQAVLVDAVIATVAAIYAVFVSDFTSSLISFLSFMVIWAAPWCGVYLVNIYLRRNRYDVPALFSSSGAYAYRHGWNWYAVGSFVIGLVAAAMFANAPMWQGPFVHLIGGGDLSIFVGFIVGGGLYYLSMRGRRVEEPAARPAVAGGS